MRYFTQEVQTDGNMKKTAGVKARDDVDSILISNGWKPIQVSYNYKQGHKTIIDRTTDHFKVYNVWKESLGSLKKNDVLLVQFPFLNHSLLLEKLIRRLKRRGIKIILLIHDLEILRKAVNKDASFISKLRLNMEEKSILLLADNIIAHNLRMIDILKKIGVEKNRIVNLGIFDYLLPDSVKEKDILSLEKPLIIAGNLRRNKAEYVYSLPESCNFNLYGIGYEAESRENIQYYGSFPPDELPDAMDGSFGLIWDGESAETCTGAYGRYLRINNPHKTSLYLACGIPVVIWKEAALSAFVERHKCGILIESLHDYPKIISHISENEYRSMCQNARKVSQRLRSGYYTLHALEQCGV